MSESEETETEVTETEVTETEESETEEGETEVTESEETEYEPLSADVDKLVTICGASRRDATAALKRTKGKLRDAAAQLMDHREEAANPSPSVPAYGSARSTGRDPFLDDRRVVLLSTVFLIPPESAKVALTVANYNIHLAETLIVKQMDHTKRRSKRRWTCCKRGGTGTRPPAPRARRATGSTDPATAEVSTSEAPVSTEVTETTETTETETEAETTETETTETETTETETTESTEPETEDTDEDEEVEESED